MISFQIIVLIIITHFIADFILQSHEMGTRKSEDIKILGLHSLIYSIPFVLISPLYAIVNGLLHGGVDNVTSKWTKKLYEQQKYHWFFVVIGLDQAIHMLVLFSTYQIMMI